MGLKDLHLKLKAFKLGRFLIGDEGKKRQVEFSNKPSWMMPISHGYHVVDHQLFKGGSDDSDFDSVVVQREQMEDNELWFFGIFDAQIGDGVTKYMQSHFFDKKLKESHLRKKIKETMRKAYLGARAKIRETKKSDEINRSGSASVMVINGEKLVIANMGEYRAIVCRDGTAHQITSRRHQIPKRHWSRRFFLVRLLACDSGTAGEVRSKGSKLVIGSERVDSDTEFVIVASNGIWEVMKNQEAVNLIRHIEDPQEAAECLAKEALTRMSKSNISCLIIRFD
ncbi:putative Protein phosphatase 2c [Quillaja saponaria]|uniref:PPM-type phosphatase domain-containing protein n=1 Tax=Quillaja saponaria TaxID=32244 RepID=A0AAD7QE48_QUISA|nr:putative Protein phosphatase 2c [Quillaja saponaria]